MNEHSRLSLVDQPSAAPTRKIAAVGWATFAGPVVAGFIAPWLPGLSEACGSELGASLVATAVATAQGAVNFASGYFTRERILSRRL